MDVANFWTDDAKRIFHENVRALKGKHQDPCLPRNYRTRRLPTSECHRLSFEDELQIADHIAYLAHYKEGSERVAAAVVQELQDGKPGLVIRLAANKTPPTEIMAGLEKIIEVVENHARAGKSSLKCNSAFN